MKKIFFFLLFLMITSCTSDEESRRQVNSSFQGNWSGTFAGDDTGVFTFVVEKEGTIAGNLTSIQNNFSENFGGYVVHTGKFDINTPRKYYFSGMLDNVKPISGQWKRYSDAGERTGTFTLKKTKL